MRVFCTPPRLRALLARERVELGRWRPQAALLSFAPWQLPLSLGLSAPYLAWAEAPPEAGGRIGDSSLKTLGAAAEAVLCPSGSLGEALARDYALPRVELIEPGFDLSLMPEGPLDEARAVLGAPPGQRFLACLSELAEDERIEALGLAQRELPGIGLVITGAGPQRSRVRAMELSTRPSSPVIHLGESTPATRTLAACASTIGVDVSASALGALELAAHGRRIVALDGPELPRLRALYPPMLCALFVAEPSPRPLRQALERALDAEDRLGPLPPDAVQAARARLDAAGFGARLAERLKESASRGQLR